MATEKDLATLLEKSIQAADRTTRAVRAFVRFLFIQLSFYTAAFITWQVGAAFEEEQCTIMGCQPNAFWQTVVAILVILGIVLSSRAGWRELELSEIPGASGTQRYSANDFRSDQPKKPKQSFKDWLKG
jgi:hypothetical protein